MKFSSHLRKTADDVSEASQQVVATSQAASIALLAIAALAVLALGVGLIALAEVKK